jgi:hypothetical protein
VVEVVGPGRGRSTHGHGDGGSGEGQKVAAAGAIRSRQGGGRWVASTRREEEDEL